MSLRLDRYTTGCEHKIHNIEIIESNTVIQKLKSEFELIYEILNQYPGNKITFLELPFYSIVKWISVHNHKEPSSFQEQDRTLENQIIHLNSEIKKINERNQSFSPDFNFDLYRTSKTKRRAEDVNSVEDILI